MAFQKQYMTDKSNEFITTDVFIVNRAQMGNSQYIQKILKLDCCTVAFIRAWNLFVFMLTIVHVDVGSAVEHLKSICCTNFIVLYALMNTQCDSHNIMIVYMFRHSLLIGLVIDHELWTLANKQFHLANFLIGSLWIS